MGREFITDGLTVGYALALSQFVMVWVLGWMYLRRADKDVRPARREARVRRPRMPRAGAARRPRFSRASTS